MRVLREYVIPDLKPDVLYSWHTEPDHIQHAFGAGAPESLASIRNVDRNMGLVLETLATLGLADRTNIMVVSDHGFGQTVYGVNLGQALVRNVGTCRLDSSRMTLSSHHRARRWRCT